MGHDRLLPEGGKVGYVVVPGLAPDRRCKRAGDLRPVRPMPGRDQLFRHGLRRFCPFRYELGHRCARFHAASEGGGPVRLPQARSIMPHCRRRLRGWRGAYRRSLTACAVATSKRVPRRRTFGDWHGEADKDHRSRRIARRARATACWRFRIRPGGIDRRLDWQDEQGGGRGRGSTGAARKISSESAEAARKISRSRARIGGPFGIGRRHLGGVSNTQLPAVVDADGVGQQWRDNRHKRRLRDRTCFAKWWCQGKR